MKKIFLFIPIALAVGGGLFWMSSQGFSSQNSVVEETLSSKSPEQLFSLSQESLKLIIRHGDKESTLVLNESVSTLETMLDKYKQQGLNVNKAENLIAQYKEDSRILSDAAQPFLEKLHQYDSEEDRTEAEFLLSIEQIGLRDIQLEYKKLCRLRLDYLKEPSVELEDEYRIHSSALLQIIRELYLDSSIEKPLYAHINNHKGYFETVGMYYKKAGIERVHRLRENSYAIKTELQMLPTM